MNILFVTSNYPYSARPYRGAFVQELVRALSRLEVNCTVINPISIFERRFGKFDSVYSQELLNENCLINVIQPRYVSASSKNLFFFNTDTISRLNYNRTVYKKLMKLETKFDLIYAHFMYPSGVLAVKLAEKMRIPSLVAFGEDSLNDYYLKKAKKDFQRVSGIVSVSNRNKKVCEETLNIPSERIRVFPNGVDLKMFYPRERDRIRKKYNFQLNKTIILFLGHFEERKGPHRILEASKGLDDVNLIFIGRGAIPLEDDKIIFKGVIEHFEVPEMLSAADMFVLPTLSEGSCNSIIEAMACGLPVISSVGDFNDDILNDEVALRIDPTDTSAIREAIIRLSDDRELRRRMSEAALEHSKKFDVNKRADKIYNWMVELKREFGCNSV